MQMFVCALESNQALCSKGCELSAEVRGGGVRRGLPDERVYHQPRSGEERSSATISDVAQNQCGGRLQPQTKIEADCLLLLCGRVSSLVWPGD